MLENRQAQAVLQSQQLNAIKDLAAEGYAPRNQVLQMEQAQAELRAVVADLNASQSRVRQEYLKEVSTQLADVRREVQSGQEKLIAVTEDLARTQLRSPVEGQVVGLTLGSTGGVVTPGQRLMDIVPKGESLMVDAKVPPHVIDKVYAGEAVEVRFSTFANSPQLVLDGRLMSVSSDVITEQTAMGNMSYYLARIEITPEGIKQLGKRVMQPGMPAEVLIKTGERSVLTYLMHPLTKRLASAMKEE
jgi:protease secretion system membrane fusion protein